MTLAERTLALPSGSTLRYLEQPAAAPGAPLVVALHHAGEGDGLPFPPYFARNMMRSIMVPGFEPLGAMIVAPDALHGEPWHTAVNQRAVVTLAERVLAAHPELDARRVLLTGYSMGGRGTWRIGPRNPGLFTALMPMAAPVEWPDEAEPARPICVLHSTEDELFDGADVRAGVAALAARGADVELRMIDGVGHFELPRFAAVVRDALPWLAGAWG